MATYDAGSLNENNMSAINIFNNDFGLKKFTYSNTKVTINLKFDYMVVASWVEKWKIKVYHMVYNETKKKFKRKKRKTMYGYAVSDSLGVIKIDKSFSFEAAEGDEIRVIAYHRWNPSIRLGFFSLVKDLNMTDTDTLIMLRRF